MPNSKHLRWVDDYGTDAGSKTRKIEGANDTRVEPAANDADGWQLYRHWISKAPAPRGRRSGIDPALYTWKGYRSWTEQIRRNWHDDPVDDND